MAVSRPPVYQEYYTRTPFQVFSGAVWKRLVAFRADESGVTVGGPVRNSRVIAFWKVDHSRLAAAVQAFAPDMRLVAHPLYRLDERKGGGSAEVPDVPDVFGLF